MRSMTSTVSVATSATSTTLTTSMTSPPSPGDLPPPSLVQRQHRQHSLQHDQSLDPKSLHTPQHQHQHQRHQDSDSADGNSDDRSDIDDGDGVDGMRSGSKRKRPISVSCELCKQRKVKCDRGQPACGWCTRNGASCEYKERKKPGLRAGYGRELEARLDKLEAILRKHSEVLHVALDASGQPAAVVPATIASLSQYQIQNAAAALNGGRGGRPASSVGGSLASEDRATPQDHHAAASSSLFGRGDITAAPTPQAEAALFLQKPLASSSSSSTFPASHPSANGNGPSNIPGLPGHGMSSPGAGTASTSTGAYSQTNGAAMAGISPSHHSQPSPLSTPAAREYYGASAPAAGAAATSPMMGLAAAAGNPHTGPDQDLPPYDLTYALVDLYFKHINTWCPLLQRNPTIEALFGPTMTDETNKILLHAIVATTLRYSTDSRLTDEKRQRYHAISKNRVLLYGMENSSVKALQAMVILALDFCGSSNGPPGWNIMALITRAVVQLGLAVESNSLSVSPSYASIYTLRAMILPEPVDFIEEESRRRLFWVIYLLDRYATIATAFEFALDDREIDRMLPCRDDLWAKNQKVETRLFHTDYTPGGINEGPGSLGANGFEPEAGGPSGSNGKPENLGAFSYYIEILGILTKIHNFLKQPVDISSLSDVEQWQMRYRELDQTLNSWKVGLPGEYGNMAKLFQPNCAKVINCGWIMLHITYHTAIIRLHSSSAYPTTRSPIFTPSYSASQRCHTAVENIGSLCEFVVSNNLLPKLGPPFAFSLWVAARLYLVHGSTVEHKLSARVYYFVDTLRAMGRYWPVASRYSLLLQRVLDEHRESERQGDGVTPGSVKILADMRRTAFDLDLLIGRQPRHVSGSSTYSTGHYSHYAQENGAHHGHNGGGLGGQAGSHGFRGHSASRFPAHTPARTPQPNDLEYLDVFDFFNVPRLPYGLPTEMNDNGINIVSGIDDSSAEHSRNGTSAQDTTIAAGSVSATSSSATGTGTGTGTADASHKRSNAVPSPPETTAPTTTTPAMAADNSSSGNGNGNGNGNGAGSRHPANAGTPSFGNEFNITDFMIDANRDWLYKHDGGSKFLA